MTTPNRRALVLTSDNEPITSIETQLVAAGYDVHRCLSAGARAFPCVGLAHGECPLDEHGGVDVAIDIREHEWGMPGPRETGVVCALRDGVPLVVVGHEHHPFSAFAVMTTDREDGFPARCEHAMQLALEPIRAAVADAVRDVFRTHDVDHPFYVHIERRSGRLRVRIETAAGDLGGMVATRAAVAVRRFDQRASSLEIEIVAPST
jgi:hypothetical protein